MTNLSQHDLREIPNNSSNSQVILNQNKKKGFWKKIYNGLFKRISHHSHESNKETTNKAKQTFKLINHTEFLKNKQKMQTNFEENENQDIAIAIKIPSGFAQEKTDIIIELEHKKELITCQQSNENLNHSTHFKCAEETMNRAVFVGTIKVPPRIDLEKITNMPLYLFDSNQEIPTNMRTDFKYLSKINPIKNSLSDNVNGNMKFGEISLKIIFQNKLPVFKSNKIKSNDTSNKNFKTNSLECSFITNISEKSPKKETEECDLASNGNASDQLSGLQLLNEISTPASSKTELISVDNANLFVQEIKISNENNLNESYQIFDDLKSLNDSCIESEDTIYPKSVSLSGSDISIKSLTSIKSCKDQVPLNSPIFERPSTYLPMYLKENSSEGVKEVNNVESVVNESHDDNVIPNKPSTETEFGGVKKNPKNITSGKNINYLQENTNRIITNFLDDANLNKTQSSLKNVLRKSFQDNKILFDNSKTGVQTIQNLYSSSTIPINYSNLIQSENEKRNGSYENLLASRYSPSTETGAGALTYNVVENDVKNMIKDLLNESNNIKNDVMSYVRYESDNYLHQSTDKLKIETIRETLKDIINCAITDDLLINAQVKDNIENLENENIKIETLYNKTNDMKNNTNEIYITNVLDNLIKNIPTHEDDVNYIIDKILDKVNEYETHAQLFNQNIENSVQHIGDSSKLTSSINCPKDVCKSQSIYYCNTNVFEHPRIHQSINETKKMYPPTISIRKLSPSKKSVIRNDENLIKILEKSNGVLTNLHNELCSYDTITYELDSTSSEHLYDTNINNKNHIYNVMQNLSAHSTTSIPRESNENKLLEKTVKNITNLKNMEVSDSSNTSSKHDASKTPQILQISNMKKSSKFLNIKTSKNISDKSTPPIKHDDNESYLNENVIRKVDLAHEPEKKKDEQIPTTSKQINNSQKTTSIVPSATTSAVNEARSIHAITFKSEINQCSEEEMELSTEDQEILFRVSDFGKDFPKKPSTYSRISKMSNRTRASTYIESVSSSEDSIIQRYTPKIRIKNKDSKIKQVFSNKSLNSSETEGLIEFPSIKPIVSNVNLELCPKSGYPNILKNSQFEDNEISCTANRSNNKTSTITVDSISVSDEEYEADREDTILALPTLTYTCTSIPELNSVSEINIIDKNISLNQELENKTIVAIESEFNITSDNASSSSSSTSILSSDTICSEDKYLQ